jgi:hypothetical protein
MQNQTDAIPNGWPEALITRGACEHVISAAGQAPFGRELEFCVTPLTPLGLI